ncbi:S41 family peptidase [Natronospirillum operosum]|uniref:S41 family peptidase n=1 Tax=Natronospirillum operosum TaxID=2759953 RepID=A0A4Z0W722_9GAMM|nr:S41 family peptidase [Natronospirillum operosum]TGG92362.1 S41 family peptidase [Natronospirillum operosum]
MIFKTRSAVSLLAVLLFGFAIGVGSTVYAERHVSEISSSLPVEEIRQLAQVIDRIKRAYVDEVDNEDLIRDAINGMLSGLDPHSAFLTPEDFSDLQESTSGRFGGLGIEVQMEDGLVKVVSPIDDTPAYHAGVQSGDLITRLDGESVQGMTLNQAVDVMRGEPGTDITLTIMRGSDTLEITIERAIIQVTSIRSRMLEPGYGMVRISSFQQNTGRDLAREIASLEEEYGGELRGLVLDLRNNPGGLLNASVDVADVFLSDKLVVYTESRIPDSAHRYHSRSSTAYPDLPLIVLVNGGSASASEIVAGALQDHGRAVVMGTQTFGKGSVQTVLPLENRSALKLTTARYFTPAGQNIQAQGITPDLVVRQGQFAVDDAPLRRERDLRGHLQTLSERVDEDPTEVEEEELINRDFQLYEALNMLKGWSILQRN